MITTELDLTPPEMMLSLRGGGGYEYVDLGLPSGLKWAKCNVGAEKETDFGDYFMWGSTKANTPDECTWANAPFNNGSNSYNETYFNSVKDTACPNGILAKGYDAASQIMGGDWRMPTKDEIQELITYTDNKWIDDFDGNGTKGYKFASKKDTSNYIFSPAAGYCRGGSVYSVGRGYVWSSSLNASSIGNAWNLFFRSDGCNMDYSNRCDGRSVRGVRK